MAVSRKTGYDPAYDKAVDMKALEFLKNSAASAKSRIKPRVLAPAKANTAAARQPAISPAGHTASPAPARPAA